MKDRQTIQRKQECVNCLHCNEVMFKYPVNKSDGSVHWTHPKRFCSSKCSTHYNIKSISGSNNPHWNGGRTVKDGYVKIRVEGEHHRKDWNGYVYEHIIVYEREHNCCLLLSAVVHHVNGDRIDNRPENLMAMTRKRHQKLTAKETSEFVKLARSFNWGRFVN